MKRRFVYLALCGAMALLWRTAVAYPTGLNNIPTADFLDTGSLRTEMENDGSPGIGSSGSTSYLFLQMGLTSKLEVGVDHWDTAGDVGNSLNAKYLVAPEAAFRPALAAGVMDITDSGRKTYYAAATKTFGRFRAHCGIISADYARGGMLGFDLEVRKGTYLIADWMQGEENYKTFGIYQELPKGWALNFFHGFSNSRDGEDPTVLNISRTISLWPGAGASEE